jgi:subtilisin family serine protease
LKDYRLTLDSGNSYSTPIVAGVAARLLTENPNLSPAELETKLEATTSFIFNAPAGSAGGRVVSTRPAAPAVIPPRRHGARH